MVALRAVGEAERLGSRLTALRRAVLYLAITLPLLPAQFLLLALRSPLARRLPRFYHRLCCRILGFEVAVSGKPSLVRPTLFVSNHVSYIDIVVLSAVLETSFIAKAEIARWPFFGWLAKLQRTVFVDRRGFRAAAQRDDIHRRLEAGDDLVLFPEGTSSNGNGVLPFKSALFAVAQDTVRGRPLPVQPISIAYTRLDGLPLGRGLRPYYAWYGGMTLLPHLWTLLGLGTVTASITFHPPVEGPAFASRKALADYCFGVISAGVQAQNRGRALPASKPPSQGQGPAASDPAPAVQS
jgi:1-acyl-sn-glycerol-3-phosphate acyltransferase